MSLLLLFKDRCCKKGGHDPGPLPGDRLPKDRLPKEEEPKFFLPIFLEPEPDTIRKKEPRKRREARVERRKIVKRPSRDVAEQFEKIAQADQLLLDLRRLLETVELAQELDELLRLQKLEAIRQEIAILQEFKMREEEELLLLLMLMD